eukprot:jgi/Mesvir1/21169/Mv13904-RA.1
MAEASGSQDDQSAVLPYLGAKISLISNSDIRYEGTLYSIDTKACNIALKDVRSFGTEGRRENAPQIPPSNEVYEYILFGASDIKVLHVNEPPAAPPITDDPAVLNAVPSSGSYWQHPGGPGGPPPMYGQPGPPMYPPPPQPYYGIPPPQHPVMAPRQAPPAGMPAPPGVPLPQPGQPGGAQQQQPPAGAPKPQQPPPGQQRQQAPQKQPPPPQQQAAGPPKQGPPPKQGQQQKQAAPAGAPPVSAAGNNVRGGPGSAGPNAATAGPGAPKPAGGQAAQHAQSSLAQPPGAPQGGHVGGTRGRGRGAWGGVGGAGPGRGGPVMDQGIAAGGARGGYRGGRGGHPHGGGARPGVTVTKFTEEFDFVVSNQRFNKEELFGGLRTEADEEHTQDATGAQAKAKAPAAAAAGAADGKAGAGDADASDAVAAKLGGLDLEMLKDLAKPKYAKDDFFDSISNDVLDRQEGKDNRGHYSDLRKLDMETFGTVNYVRGGGRGRGGYRRGGGGNFRGGYRSYGGDGAAAWRCAPDLHPTSGMEISSGM